MLRERQVGQVNTKTKSPAALPLFRHAAASVCVRACVCFYCVCGMLCWADLQQVWPWRERECVWVCDGSEQVCVHACVALPSQPGEESRLCLASQGKVSQQLLTLLASDQNRMWKCQRTKKNKRPHVLFMHTCMTHAWPHNSQFRI